MHKDAHLQRITVAIELTESCISNIACYKAGWTSNKLERRLINASSFWTRINGNFLDVATLDWCKLFLDKNIDKHSPGEYCWKNIFNNHSEWLDVMYCETGINEQDFKKYGMDILNYRNKFLAHRDKNEMALYYPRTEILLKTASYLNLKLMKDAGYSISGNYFSIHEFYTNEYNLARREILASINSSA